MQRATFQLCVGIFRLLISCLEAKILPFKRFTHLHPEATPYKSYPAVLSWAHYESLWFLPNNLTEIRLRYHTHFDIPIQSHIHVVYFPGASNFLSLSTPGQDASMRRYTNKTQLTSQTSLQNVSTPGLVSSHSVEVKTPGFLSPVVPPIDDGRLVILIDLGRFLLKWCTLLCHRKMYIFFF